MLALGIIVASVVLGYAVVGGILFFRQRNIQYMRESFRTPPSAIGISNVEELRFETPDGETLVAWHVPAKSEKPTIVYLHGSVGALRTNADRFHQMVADGSGLIALSYRGYGGSTGRPTERGLITDACAAFDFASSRFNPDKLVIWGTSLGAAVAAALAVRRPVRRLILEGPFTSALATGQRRYPLFPLRWFMLDQYHTDKIISKVTAALLIVHGENDELHPISDAENLLSLAHGPKQLIRVPRGMHNDLLDHGLMTLVRPFCMGT
jgi:uncharacterized protein